MEARAPVVGPHVAILVHWTAAVALFESSAQRRANPGAGASVEQQSGEARLVGLALAVVDPESTLADDRRTGMASLLR